MNEAAQIFKYLLELKNLKFSVVRDIRQYKNQHWWQAELPIGDGCHLRSTDSYEDAWLKVHKQAVSPEPPSPPLLLNEWLKDASANPDKPPTYHQTLCLLSPEELEQWDELRARIATLSQSKELSQKENDSAAGVQPLEKTQGLSPLQKRWGDLEARREVAFDADPQRAATWEQWISLEWEPWAKSRRIQTLYERLFDVYQELQREENIELNWGHGLLTWDIDGMQIRRPVLATRMELIFDAGRGFFSVIPTEKGTLLETDMLSDIDLPNKEHLRELEFGIQENGIDPWDKSAADRFFQELANTLGGESSSGEQVSGSKIDIKTTLIIYDAPVLFIRTGGRQWQTDLRGIINAIRDGQSVPETITALAADTRSQPDENLLRKWQPVGEDLLFPLPANEEQREIVRRLARNFGVVVQGPPGTGKSHTIVNLIAHLLAHGKRILVTSQTERALRVLGNMLREKLPEIAPLCVNLLGGDSRSMKELEHSINGIANKVDTIDPDSLERDVVRLRSDLEKCRGEIARLRTEIKRAAEAEYVTFSIKGSAMEPIKVAEWLADNQIAHGWFPDPLPPDSKPPLSEQEVSRLYHLVGILSTSDRHSIIQRRPPAEKLPTADALEQHFARLADYEASTPRRREILEGWTLPPESPSRINEAIALATQACSTLKPLSSGWLRRIVDDMVHGGQRAEYWNGLVTASKRPINGIRKAESQIAAFNIQAPKNIDFQQTLRDMTLLGGEFKKSKALSFFFRRSKGKHTLYILHQYRVNNHAPRSVTDIRVLHKHVGILAEKKRLATQWNNSVHKIGGPTLDPSTPRFLQTLEDHLAAAETALNWNNDHLQPLLDAAGDISPPGSPAWSDLETLTKYRDGLQAYTENLAFDTQRRRTMQLSQFLRTGKTTKNAHPSWGHLLTALEQQDVEAWARELEELGRLADLEPQVLELNRLYERLEAVAPRWLSEIEAQGGAGKPLTPSKDWMTAWEYRRADTWIERHANRIHPEDLQQRLQEAKSKEARLIEELVAQMTWLEQSKRLRANPEQRQALIGWLQSVRKIGKGTSKYIDRYRAYAKREMAESRKAVPVWIMPLDRVIESFSPESNLFDVIIVDESSQCDLFALAALFRARRAVVVGDDKQISPRAVGSNLKAVHNLIDKHLRGIPHHEHFDPRESLYSTAQRIFPGQLVLKEHFRCAPEIIQFSNDSFYNGIIEPLRIPSAEKRLTPAVTAVRVLEGYRDEGTRRVNEPEARALVEKIVALCGQREYENRTMGVISLLGKDKDQAYLIEQILREQLEEKEIVDRRLICGDAYSFQGDERDVMFLSLVAAPNVRNRALTDRPSQQRFNVAASRAKDQMWLFHSIDLDDLNPEDMRHHLLRYCLNPTRTQYEMESVEDIFKRYGSSRFHREVHRMIVARGYRAIPELKVGTHPYRIDTVIEGLHSRLAVECDGDEWHGIDRWEADSERQAVLERVGWKFWRVRGSVFYRDREKAMEPLWELLDEMDIRPDYDA